MGRHSTGKNNYALSKGAIAAVVALALLLAAAVWWVAARGKSDPELDARNAEQQQECVSGDLALPVAASTESVARELISNYANSQPVVRDYCVQPVYVDRLADAAVYIAPNTPISHQEIAQVQRSATTNEPPAVYANTVGVAGPKETQAAATDIKQVDFPTGDQPEASALVASALAGDDNAAVEALSEQRIDSSAQASLNSTRFVATADNAVPDGFVFSPLSDVNIVYSAIPLSTSDSVTEDQTRAAQAFADFAAEQFGDAAELPVLSETIWAAALPNGGERITAGPEDAEQNEPAAEPLNTLFLLDTSDGMAAFADDTAGAISAAADALVEAGQQVALWNYSSPLSPGVTQGFRRNIEFTDDAASVGAAASRFINGGVPQTHEAVAAATDYAQTAAPARIVLITSGTADTDTPVADIPEGVELVVVHVGEGEQDQALIDAAASSTTAPSPNDIEQALRELAGV